MMNLFKKYRYTGGLAALALFFVVTLDACKKSSDEVPEVVGNAKMKYVNAQSGSQPQEAFIGDTKVSTAPVAYNNSSDYLTVSAGTRTLSFKDQTSGTLSASSQLNIPADVNFTSYYVKNAQGTGQVLALLDDLTPPAPSTQARVRFLNLGATFTNGVNVTEIAGGNQFISSLLFGNVSQYFMIPPNTALKVSPVGAITATDIPTGTFAAGKIYTVWINANANGNAEAHIVVHN
ncbi:DUF4397 domain-containing protein [Pedobacter sp. SYP-B3415]|uniref:DUF4397 domain-containing protein n=1 Tax=Pedobacter sp. SYP-B3415 TaxID=2496641 RepID=UPI00101DB18E|nr:DUF4397 domain-containing protein [Pedobacter sp. SYP-B3415]